MSITKQVLSGSTNGAGIKVAATATPGTLLHTAVTGTASLDEIWIYLTNTDTVDRKITIEYGGATAPDQNVKFIVPTGETIIAITGLVLNNGLTVKAFADAANVVNALGFVNRIT
jgi:hypothetical protein